MIARRASHALDLPLSILTLGVVASTYLACSSTSSTTTTGPSPVKCQVTLSPPPNTFASSGGSGNIMVSAQPECAWTASAAAIWIGSLSPTSGQGNGQVTFQVPANPVATAREGSVVINDASVMVRQDGTPCRIDVSPHTFAVESAGGARSVTVSAPGGCSWNATSSVDWIAITAGSSATGAGTVAIQISQNSGAARTGALTVAGQEVTVTQGSGTSSPGCTYVVERPPPTVPAVGISGQIAVTTNPGCTWTAQRNVAWITITAGSSGTGTGAVTLVVSPNTGPARSAVLTIAGHVFEVTQAAAAACAYSISPTSESIGSAGGGGTVTITTTAACSWTATSGASWITITSAVNGTGNGSLNFAVAANTGSQRTGTLTIAGHSFTVTQAGTACTYSINPTSENVNPSSGSGPNVKVTASAGCSWTAVSNSPWLTVKSGASGSGNGTVSYDVAANTGGQRTGTIMIAGHPFTVTQSAAPCSYSIKPTTVDVSERGSPEIAVAVATASHCTWTATTNNSWIVMLSGQSGTGSGTVRFAVLPNTGKDRAGKLTIAGLTCDVKQDEDD